MDMTEQPRDEDEENDGLSIDDFDWSREDSPGNGPEMHDKGEPEVGGAGVPTEDMIDAAFRVVDEKGGESEASTSIPAVPPSNVSAVHPESEGRKKYSLRRALNSAQVGWQKHTPHGAKLATGAAIGLVTLSLFGYGAYKVGGWALRGIFGNSTSESGSEGALVYRGFVEGSPVEYREKVGGYVWGLFGESRNVMRIGDGNTRYTFVDSKGEYPLDWQGNLTKALSPVSLEEVFVDSPSLNERFYRGKPARSALKNQAGEELFGKADRTYTAVLEAIRYQKQQEYRAQIGQAIGKLEKISSDARGSRK